MSKDKYFIPVVSQDVLNADGYRGPGKLTAVREDRHQGRKVLPCAVEGCKGACGGDPGRQARVRSNHGGQGRLRKVVPFEET